MKPRDELHDGRYARAPADSNRRHGYFKIVETWEQAILHARSPGSDSNTRCTDLVARLSPYLSVEEHKLLCRQYLEHSDMPSITPHLIKGLETILDNRHEKVKRVPPRSQATPS